MTHDVLIVGAGPAGSIAALCLARSGVRVRLVDRARFPREKLCGDTVNPGALAQLHRLGLGTSVRAQAIPVDGMIVTGPGGARITADYGGRITGAALTRAALDHALLEASVAAGVAFEPAIRVTEPIVHDGRVVGVMASSATGRLTRWPASIVVAADGRASSLGRALGLSHAVTSPRRWAYGAYFQGVEALSSYGEMHVRRDGYIGIAPLPGGLANVCVVREWHRGRSFPVGADTLERVVRSDPWLRPRFAAAARVSPVRGAGPLGVEADRAGMPGLLLAGDAAGFVDPITGDGLRFACRGGELAALAALHELERGTPMHEWLAAERHHEFAGKLRLNRAIRRLVASPAAVSTLARLARAWPAPLRPLIAAAGDVALATEAGS